jgi:cytoplasmic iron level regulating protein YaaA (DUF328/UPF0246 family)
VLLPPSEGKAPGGDGPARVPGWFAELEPARARVLSAVTRPRLDHHRVLGVEPAAASRAAATNTAAASSPTLPALLRYTGVLFRSLDYPGLPPVARRRAVESVVIVSGLWGLLRGDDPVPDYKLPIGASLPRLGPLAAWWRPRLSPVLDAHAAGRVVWDLLPVAYAAAWATGTPGTAPPAEVRRVRLIQPDGRPAGHAGKHVKGLLARHLLLRPRALPAELAELAAGEGLRAVVQVSQAPSRPAPPRGRR